jgi:hypothetical protein
VPRKLGIGGQNTRRRAVGVRPGIGIGGPGALGDWSLGSCGWGVETGTPLVSPSSLTLTSSSTNGALVVFGGSGAYRTVTITPKSGASGSANITILADDNQGGTYPMTFGITVDGVNDAPTPTFRRLARHLLRTGA